MNGWMGGVRLCGALLPLRILTILTLRRRGLLAMLTLRILLLMMMLTPHQTIGSATILIGSERSVAGMTGGEAGRGGFAGHWHCFVVHAAVVIAIHMIVVISIGVNVTCRDVADAATDTSGVIVSSGVTTASIITTTINSDIAITVSRPTNALPLGTLGLMSIINNAMSMFDGRQRR